MKKSVKKKLYTLTAILTAFIIFFAQTGNTYAASFNEGKYDAGWHYYLTGCCWDPSKNVECDGFDFSFSVPDNFTAGGNAAYTEHLQTFERGSTFDYASNYTFESNSEIVLVVDYSLSSENQAFLCTHKNYALYSTGYVWVLSKDNIYVGETIYNCRCDLGESFSEPSRANTTTRQSNNVITLGDYGDFYYMSYHTQILETFEDNEGKNHSYPWAVKTGKMKVFNVVEDACKYLTTGDTSGIAWQGSDIKGYNSDLHFEEFSMSLHKSNSYDNFYVDFSWVLPDSLLNSGCSLKIVQTYRREVGDGSINHTNSSKDYEDYQYITLNDNPFGCRLYLDDFNCIQKSYDDLDVAWDINDRKTTYKAEWVGVIPSTQIDVTMSYMYLTCYLVNSGVYGFAYDGAIDILDGSNYMSSFVPDNDGNYVSNNDKTANGYYYTKVGTDAAGNTTYNYYYYGDDNSYREISAEDSHNNSYSGALDVGVDVGSGGGGSASGDNSNNNVNNPIFNNNNSVNVTVEGDEISNDAVTIVNSDSNTTKEKNDSFITRFLGFFQILENNTFLSVLSKMFGWIPSDVLLLMTGGIGIVAGVAVFRFFRK